MAKRKTVVGLSALCIAALIAGSVLTGCDTDASTNTPEKKTSSSNSYFQYNSAVQIDTPYTTEGNDEVAEEYEDTANKDEKEQHEEAHLKADKPKTEAELQDAFNKSLALVQGPHGPEGGDADHDLQNLMSAQFVSFTDTINTGSWSLRDGTKQNRTAQIQTNYYVYAAYSFENKKDYYIVRQEIIIPNGNLWGGMRKKYTFPAYYRSKDFWMSGVHTDNTLGKGSVPLGHNALAISDYSPETTNNVNYYNEGISWGVSGSVGVTDYRYIEKDMGSGFINGGVSFSSSHSWTVQDVDVVAKVMGDSKTENAAWIWTTNKRCGYDYSIGITEPPDLAKSTAKFGTSWVWVVDKPAADDQYTLNTTVGGTHASTSFYATGADMSTRSYGWSFKHSIVLDAPNRTPSPSK